MPGQFNNQKHAIVSDRVKVRKDSDNNMFIEGYAIVFNEWTNASDGVKQRVLREALNQTKIEDVRLLHNHDWGKLLARQSTGTLKLYNDGKGLKVEAKLVNTSFSKEVYEQIANRNLNQCSFNIEFKSGEIITGYHPQFGTDTRTIYKLNQIEEISIVSSSDQSKNEPLVLEGYAIVFNEWSDIVDNKRETISKHALNATVFDDVRLLFNHDWSKVLGRETAETLKLTVDDKGLKFKVTLPDTTTAQSVYEDIQTHLYNRCGYSGGVVTNVIYNNDLKIHEVTITEIKKISEISIDPKGKYKGAIVWPGKRELTRKEKLQLLKLELELYNL
ncbi:hypothetical protein ERX37_04825 [Macrococcus hajekii]|uniref:Prohead serine protease domain-containing protein n=1 Tax=Macrococcus hajekii TaxID=198482 RepID=A0A4R6BNM5_9STAP|nr:HK97 family phage prohead protease [Macrococcus hajekii]TDM03411.1 hypothetical protein ERX37_04825 [Macrococcus hajekii]GGA98661.1 hypothetical protein GCM10007190_03310 [Macrococcus hajekii]